MKIFFSNKFLVQAAFFFIIINLAFLSPFDFVFAQREGELSMSPSVIDDSAAPREMLEYSIKLKNSASYKLNIFPLLADLEKEETKINDSLLDRQYKMTEWISIKRGSIEIMPNGEIQLPLKVDIPGDAMPGEYFISITFAHGSNRGEAEENAVKMSPPKLFINLKVEDQSIEKASILKYNPTKKIFIKSVPALRFDLNNSGNIDLTPTGYIYLYNKRQQEVDSININPDSKMAPAGKVSSFELFANTNLKTGKYKARLEIEYGGNRAKEISDTTYLIVISLPFLLFFGVGILLFIVLLSALIFRKTYHHPDHNHHEHIQKISVRKSKEGEVINLKSK